MNLGMSFVHNVLVHPLLFVAQALEAIGLDAPMAIVEALHEASVPDATDAAPEWPENGPEPEPEPDLTEGWATPAQSPHTAESRALEWRPPPPAPEPEPEPELQGSAAARLRSARRTG